MITFRTDNVLGMQAVMTMLVQHGCPVQLAGRKRKVATTTADRETLHAVAKRVAVRIYIDRTGLEHRTHGGVTQVDKANGIVINHNQDWSGEVRISWHVAGALPLSWPECWCQGPDLVAGRFTSLNGTYDVEPPVNVLTRAVALAVESYLRSKMESALDDLFIERGKL